MKKDDSMIDDQLPWFMKAMTDIGNDDTDTTNDYDEW